MVSHLNKFAQYGLGYSYAQFLFNIYLLLYSVSIALGKFEGIDMPAKPKCPGRIHLYSDMWKWFDVGIYEFLFK